eukprot:6201855-Pleurochrysis_carterae.AAC.1
MGVRAVMELARHAEDSRGERCDNGAGDAADAEQPEQRQRSREHRSAKTAQRAQHGRDPQRRLRTKGEMMEPAVAP